MYRDLSDRIQKPKINTAQTVCSTDEDTFENVCKIRKTSYRLCTGRRMCTTLTSITLKYLLGLPKIFISNYLEWKIRAPIIACYVLLSFQHPVHLLVLKILDFLRILIFKSETITYIQLKQMVSCNVNSFVVKIL